MQAGEDVNVRLASRSAGAAVAFDQAAHNYHANAFAQSTIASTLVEWANPPRKPRSILDFGCGTGLLAQALNKRWPEASLTGFDISASMLKHAVQNVPALKPFKMDAKCPPSLRDFDAIFSSMMLHWLPDPSYALSQWASTLAPEANLYAVVPIEGSFPEWRKVCESHGAGIGLWPLPSDRLAQTTAHRREIKDVTFRFPSALSFLRNLKMIGAATALPSHVPLSAAEMRAVLKGAPCPFDVTYKLLYIEASSAGNR